MNRLQQRRLSRALDELFGDFGTGAAPSVGTVYTDKPTVQRVQKALYLDPDGVIGPKTRAAVKAFNEKRGAPQDGENITDGLLAAIAARDAEAAAWPVFGPPAPEASRAENPVPSSAGVVRPTKVPAAAAAGGGLLQGIPTWQLVLGALGVAAIGTGAFLLARKK